MAYREVSRKEIAEVICYWRAESGPQQISSDTGLSRNTVRKYLAAARRCSRHFGPWRVSPNGGRCLHPAGSNPVNLQARGLTAHPPLLC